MKIGLLSDTHGYIDDKIFHYFEVCDEIWHAGDIGTMEVANRLSSFKDFRAVHGNIDGPEIRQIYPPELEFEFNGMKVYMTHIGGYPPRYKALVRKVLDRIRPDLFICGHSHIVKVMKDNERKLLHLNPGAAGRQGFHKLRSLMRFGIVEGKIENLELIDLGKRG